MKHDMTDEFASAKVRRVIDKLRDGLEYAAKHGISFTLRVEGMRPTDGRYEAAAFKNIAKDASPLQIMLGDLQTHEDMDNFIAAIVENPPTKKEARE